MNIWTCGLNVEGAVDELVGLGGLEPPTSPLSGARSSHLSYRPDSNTTLKF
jgi:hypothetical protein